MTFKLYNSVPNGIRKYAPRFFAKDGMYQLVKERIIHEVVQGRTIHPADPFRCFKAVEFEDVRVVLIGKEPYCTGHSNGLAYSCHPMSDTIHPWTGRIFKEYQSDLGYPYPRSGDLSVWAKRGVLLMNTILTVEHGLPGSHYDIGWWQCTREVMYRLNDERRGLVFLLWGRHAQKYKDIINPKKHHILSTAHPQQLSGDAWDGSAHFSKTCELLGINREFWKLR